MHNELIIMLASAAFFGLLASALARTLARSIIRQEGRTGQAAGAGQIVADTVIVASLSMLCMASFAYAEMGYGQGGPGAMIHAIIAGIFGAAFGAAGWSDARTSIVPDTLIGGAMAAHFALTFSLIFPEAGGFALFSMALLGIGVFVTFCLLFQNMSWMSLTPSDASFYLIILTIPHSPAAFVVNAIAVIAAYSLLKSSPGIARAMVSKGEQEYLERILSQVYGEDSSRRQGWVPIGPMALIVATASLLANLVIAL